MFTSSFKLDTTITSYVGLDASTLGGTDGTLARPLVPQLPRKLASWQHFEQFLHEEQAQNSVELRLKEITSGGERYLVRKTYFEPPLYFLSSLICIHYLYLTRD
ncbi:hypothetical protein BD779DRAFT_1517846 [Infundibulicybe gibba]|nr:hypothetical protein BD779DRAFT_1517846 [Infundibulicybe gibba]